VWIRDSTSPHFTIKEDATFAKTVPVSMSSTLYVDAFPAFLFHATTPRKIWTGNMSGWEPYKVAFFTGDEYNVATCNDKCKTTKGCETFQVFIKSGKTSGCALMKYGSGRALVDGFNYYEKFDSTDMTSCKMAKHVLTSNSGTKIKCQNSKTCD
jgi:hypothetical protein